MALTAQAEILPQNHILLAEDDVYLRLDLRALSQ